MTIAQGNTRSVFYESLLEHAKQGRALDAISDSWELLDFRHGDHLIDSEAAVWDQVATHSSLQPALASQAAPGSFATAVLSARGSIVSVDSNFALWLGSPEMAVTLREMRDFARLARSGRAARGLINDRLGRPILVAGLERHIGLCWPLSEQAKLALQADQSAICLVAFAPTRADDLQANVKTLFGLSTSEARLAIALLHHDRLEDAAQAIGITEATANGYRKSLFKKMAVKRRGELVQMILETGHRERTNDMSRVSVALRDMFGLSADQLMVLDQLSLGRTIPEAAKSLTMNVHTARDHVRTMFELVGVNKQSELVRVALEYGALVCLSEASEVRASSISDLLSNTRILARPTQGLIYLADYGPKDGVPIVFFHAGLGTRRIIPGFLRDAARAGLRIIAIERPGFGGTDLRPEPGFEGSAKDADYVMEKLGLQTAIIASIGGGNISALSFAHLFPHRVRAGLLINPTPPREHEISPRSPAASLRRITLSNPSVIRAMAMAFRNQTRSDLLDTLLDKYFSACAPDRQAMAIPEVRSLQRASTQAVLARTIEGFVREEECFAKSWSVPQLSAGRWTIAVGLQDTTCDAILAQRIWKDLPGFDYVPIQNAGRMILVSRGRMIVDCLTALARDQPMPIDPLLVPIIKSAA